MLGGASKAAGVLSLPVLLVVVAGYGTASLMSVAALMSTLPRLVPTAHLQRARSRIDGADAVAQTAGPALAGLLVKLGGRRWRYWSTRGPTCSPRW